MCDLYTFQYIRKHFHAYLNFFFFNIFTIRILIILLYNKWSVEFTKLIYVFKLIKNRHTQLFPNVFSQNGIIDTQRPRNYTAFVDACKSFIIVWHTRMLGTLQNRYPITNTIPNVKLFFYFSCQRWQTCTNPAILTFEKAVSDFLNLVN